MVKMHKRGKKVYTVGYKIIKEKAQTGKRSSLQKIWAEGKDNILSVTFAVLFLIGLFHEEKEINGRT